ncbi:MAG: hypothetical protein ORN51_14095 [Akkermansiaceae bacterium]|nr:hypothetical protein [Akkermansiaceae bacterium]
MTSFSTRARAWLFLLSIFTALFSVGTPRSHAGDRIQSLAGNWQVRLDPKSIGQSQNWTAIDAHFDQSMDLPGTTDQAGLGIPLATMPAMGKDGLSRLYRKNSYIGAVYYRRSIEIPADWSNQRITLTLERVLWESQVWLDGKECGRQDSLSTPHLFDLSHTATPGSHELVIRVDNRPLIDTGRSHAYIEDTQSIWNGIIGKIELKATPLVWIDRVSIDPDPAKASATIVIGNASATAGNGTLVAQLMGPSNGSESSMKITLPAAWNAQAGTITIDLTQFKTIPLWSEFHPNLCTLDLTLTDQTGSSDHRATRFGFRKISNIGKSLVLNNLPIFLRGTHEGASFPLTGHPPTAVEDWRRIFKIIKSWGLNHMRFHSYCPPDACFTAADEEGIYLQAELPLWVGDLGKAGDDIRTQWVRNEAKRMVQTYGNHPSFLLFSLGNELHGQYPFLQQFLGDLRTADTRRLYSMTSNRLWVFDAPPNVGQSDGPPIVDDFLVERAFRANGKLEGMRGQSFFNEMPNTTSDFRNVLNKASLPLITHEIGQWNVFPNLAEIKKYTGVLRPINLEAIQDDLRRSGLVDQAAEFTQASGKFSAELYKQELELAMRTPGLAGYQLLDLHDYPGQGTAHVGLLDSFWDSKGIVDPAWFREACASVVPLARMPKRVYTSNETFHAAVEFTNYSEHPISNITPHWKIVAPKLGVIAQGTLPARSFPIGAGIDAGEIMAPLAKVTHETQATLEISAPGAGAINHWKIWILPPTPTLNASDVLVTQSLTDAKTRLHDGGKVLYCPPSATIRQRQDTGFLPSFWSPVYFNNQAGTMGLLIQENHPALANFPTTEHSDWQWWSILTPSPGAIVLDQINYATKPIVQVIDAFSRNQKLALIFEAKSETGHLVVCAADIAHNEIKDPMLQQLRSSLVKYLHTTSHPKLPEITTADLDVLFLTDAVTTERDSIRWSKDLEPPPEKK